MRFDPAMTILMPPSSRRRLLAVPLPDVTPRDRLLEAATRLFCRYGINATGIDLVVSEAGTAKTTLYKTFGSKERLVEAVLEREGGAWRDWFFAAIDEPGLSPRARLQRIFPALKDWFGKDEFFGCPFINAIGEHDKAEDRLRAITLRHKTLVLQRIAEIADAAGCAEPGGLSHQIGLLMDGAIVAAMVTRDRGMADAAGAAASALIEQALPVAIGRRMRARQEAALPAG